MYKIYSLILNKCLSDRLIKRWHTVKILLKISERYLDTWFCERELQVAFNHFNNTWQLSRVVLKLLLASDNFRQSFPGYYSEAFPKFYDDERR